MMLAFFLLAFVQFYNSVESVKGCAKPLGLENGLITNSQIIASSHLRGHDPFLARLHEARGPGAWCSESHIKDQNPWIKVNFGERMKVTKIAVQGRHHKFYSGWYVYKFKVGYEKNGNIHFLDQVFDGPRGKSQIVNNFVTLETSQIIIKPVKWYPYIPDKKKTNACLRMEIYGCQAPPDFCNSITCEHRCENMKDRAQCRCPPGFHVLNNGSCQEINECSEGLSSCDTQTTYCVNTIGSYECRCNDPGLQKIVGDAYACYDKNECQYNNGGCDQYCKNTFKSFKCSCRQGFYLGNDTRSCVDQNECTNGLSRCDLNTTTCVNIPGTYMCNCLSGLERIPLIATKCRDIDECAANNGGCDETCTNKYRSYKCSCRPGTLLAADGHKCNDINECALNTAGCDQECRNKYGGYECSCRPGWRLNNDQKTCSDINECLITVNGKGLCEHTCQNTIGSFLCFCPAGLKLGADKRTCIDINECSNRLDTCDYGTSTCVNTHGSYECRCLSGFMKNSNGKCTAKKCPSLKAASNGYLSPPDCNQEGVKIYKDVCTFKCNPGYEPNRASVKTAYCNSDGRWDLRGGYQHLCKKIRCGNITEISGGFLTPSICTTAGAEYGGSCEIFCNGGLYLKGRKSITCQINGKYDGDFKNSTCVKKERIICPSDLKITLPIGAKDTILPLVKLDKKVDVSKLISSPAGVLTGKYKFTSKTSSQAVKLMFKDYTQESCTFYVTVKDHEPPTYQNCSGPNIYVSLSDSNMKVSWNEPVFKDNVGVTKVIQNMKNNQNLPQQVYFVFYAARDEFGNEATCRFFVHVKVRYCTKASVPGGEGGQMIWFGGGDNLSLFLQCLPGTTYSKNVSQASIFRCSKGIWEDVPDCVGYIKKNGTCPNGTVYVKSDYNNNDNCANCPKGTQWTPNGCMKCNVGSYQEAEGKMLCKKCPLGTTSIQPGSTQCQAQCTPGAYSSNGLYGTTGCKRCPEGSFQDLHGQRSCKLCPHGGKSDLGATSEDHCYLPARVSFIDPKDEVISARSGDTVVVKCYGTGNPVPFMEIKSVAPLPPASFRGQAILQPLVTGNKYISGIQLTITNVQAGYDSQIYKCTADNRKGNKGNLDEREIVISVE